MQDTGREGRESMNLIEERFPVELPMKAEE
jgi:hypothetical protein